jgi:hypothetical protein
MSQKIVSVNIIGTNNKILNKDGIPILFYYDEKSNIEDALFTNNSFIEYLNTVLFTIENYSDAKISYCFYNEVNGKDEYDYVIKEVEDWKPFSDISIKLDEEYIKQIVNKLYRKIFETEFVWTMNFTIDITNFYNAVITKYPERFSSLTFIQYVRKELSKYDLKQHNVEYIITKLKSIFNIQ